MNKLSVSFFEDFKKIIFDRLNNSPECNPQLDKDKWYDCVYNICVEEMNKYIENSNLYIPDEKDKIDENHHIHQFLSEIVEQFMNQLKGTRYPQYASNNIKLLYSQT